MDQDPEIIKLIEQVKGYKCLWDMQSEEYYDKKLYRAAWKAIVPMEPLKTDKPEELKQKRNAQFSKIADVADVWVDLRNSYFRNDHPGKKYKEFLRFLDCVYQSREIEDLLEFSEPSWDLMDLRTWNVKQSHIPKDKRLTNPAPECEKELYDRAKRPKLDIEENKDADKDKDTAKDTTKDTDKNMDKDKIKDTSKNMDIDKIMDKDNNIDTGKNIATHKNTDQDTDKVTDKDTDKNTDKDTNKNKNTEKDTDKNAGTDANKDTDKDKENKAEVKKKYKEKTLSILEKAMTLYEIENPGVWDSDGGSQVKVVEDKEPKTYVEASTQTDETDDEVVKSDAEYIISLTSG